MAVVVADPGADDRDTGTQCREERGAGGGRAPVVGDLEEVEPAGHLLDRIEERAIHVLLEVAREQEPLSADPDVEHDRRVVDLPPRVRRCLGDEPGRWPDDIGASVADRESVALREADDRDAVALGLLVVGAVATALAEHPVVGEDADAVAREESREPADVVLVWMGREHDVDPAVPDRDPFVEPADEDVRVAAAIDEDPHPIVSLDEDRVALPDVEHRDMEGAQRSGDEGERRGAEDRDEAGRYEGTATAAGTDRGAGAGRREWMRCLAFAGGDVGSRGRAGSVEHA
jgi:hypothetical protein